MAENETPLLHELAGPFSMDGSREDGVLLLHGFTGSPAHLRMLGDHLHDEGFTVHAPLYAGHGTTLEEMVEMDWRDWIRSSVEAAAELADRCERIHIAGLSMGGIIGVLIAPTFGATSLTTINAPIITHSRLLRFARAWHFLQPMRPPGTPEPPEDAVAALYYQQYHGAPTRSAGDLLDLMRAAKRNLGRVRCETLIIQSRTDETVRPESAEILYEGIAAPYKRIHWLDDARHVALLDDDRDEIHRIIVRHLNSSIARA